ncbi:motility protein A [Marinilactibacillus piezotolerans]|uniref:motility protein A n=1 Tax=Marinilactibacillus piezotolerans TaxID=258723 RepID=UPI0009B06143|nr:motility protein A [Marinilactibacillus piezotolerans]
MKRSLTPIIGMILGIGLVIYAMSSSGPLAGYFDVPSLIITLLGSFCALLISYPIETMKKVPGLMKKLLSSPDTDRVTLIENMIQITKKSRVEGILSIESDIKELPYPLMKYGLEMVVDGTDEETIKELMTVQLEQIENRHSVGHEVFAKWGEYAPAFGMIGTLVGLIAMLGDLQDPSLIGAGMATALLTTFYGSFLANLVFIPISKNLEMQTADELKTNEMIIEGVLALQKGDNPRVIEQKLQSYISPRDIKADVNTEDPVAVTER